ncbi:zinc finger protein 558-like isoform X2 [Uranotaenia lowii]|nr:zinc finger protein 558-like isoform X2 [Uranotaenia lowii]
MEPMSCQSCHHMLEAFEQFKKSCLDALAQIESRLDSDLDNDTKAFASVDKYEVSRNLSAEVEVTENHDSYTGESSENRDQVSYSEEEYLEQEDEKPIEERVRKSPSKKKKLECSLCSATFLRPENLRHHENMHKGIKSVPCRRQDCKKLFFDTGSRARHEQYCQRAYLRICSVCGQTLTADGSYRLHMSKHKGLEFSCDICKKKFAAKPNLIKHAKVHTDERNHECKVCGKKFKSSYANRVHQRIHTQEKPYECNICGEKFTYNCGLKNHLAKGHS